MLLLIIILAVIVLIFLVTGVYAIVIWITRRRYTRERFAFATLSAIVSLTIALGASAYLDLTPWHIAATLLEVGFDVRTTLPEPRFMDFAFLGLLYVVAVASMLQLHRQWDGLKSVDQYRREQRSELRGLLKEGLAEIARIATRQPAPQPHSRAHYTQFIDQLEPVFDSLAWKDQARELLRLSSSSYAFDRDSGWNDKGGCWTGTNLDTGDPVILYPTQSSPDHAQLTAFTSYAERLIPQERRGQAEFIVAVRDDGGPPATEWNGWPIRFETESTLLDGLVNFTDYRNEIIRRAEVERLPDSELSIRDVYVPSRFFTSDASEPNADVEAYMMEWAREPGQRHLALLGEYGQGKSTAALMFTYRFFRDAHAASDRVPLLIELRGTSPRNLTPLSLLGAWAAKYRMDAQALVRLLIAGRLLLIFEGFDEMALVGDAEMRLKHFKTLWQFCYPKAKIVITGRPNFFLDEEEMRAALGIRREVGDRPYCEPVRLAPFDINQIKGALRSQKPNVRDQISSLAAGNPGFFELISRPSLLQIVSVLWERERLSESVEELTSARVMDVFVRHSYRRQGAKEADSPEFMALTTSEREYFMGGIASYMAANNLPNQIGGSALNDLIDRLVEAIPDSVSSESTAISGETTKPLRLRVQESEHGIEHVRTDVRACGLLVDDPTAPGTFHFGHKSFMEYLFAAVLSERIQDDRSARARAILRVTTANTEHILNSPESIHFLSELIGAGAAKAVTTKERVRSGNQITVQRFIAFRLLRTIGGGNPLTFALLRLHAFDTAVRRSAWRCKSFKIRLVGFLSPAMLFGFFLSLLLCILFFMPLGRLSGTWSPREILLILYSVAIPFFAFWFALVFRRPKTFAKLRLWNRICRELQIDDRVLHRLVGTWLLPWATTQPMDFFLVSGSDAAEERAPERPARS